MPNRTPDEGGTGRGLVWLGVCAGALVMGVLLYALFGQDKDGERLRQYCENIPDGSPIENVAAEARELGFDVRELKDSVLITVSGKRFGQSCFLTIVEGNVTDVHSVVTH
jgi:hypothetical protein